MNEEFELLFSQESYNDLDTIQDFYFPISEELVKDVQDEILRYLEIVKERPFTYQKRHKNIRACFTPRFHFGIYFSVDEIEKIIFVIGIINTKEDLQKIKNRNNN